ncbi:MAG: GH3 auxin-responsive promoter family protein [Bacteroidales bacterium]|nr:GH3 auxin-responsive promoter family protein [Bacteroidales bacterium]
MTLINSIFNLFSYSRMEEIEHFQKNPGQVQTEMFNVLIDAANNTEFGLEHQFERIRNQEDFSKLVPLREYDDLKPYIDKIINGEQNILWPTEIKWFAKSSGTTSDKSKFIPISKESLEDCHFRSGKDIVILFNELYPESNIFSGKTLALGGSTSINQNNNKSYYGDLSAVLIRNLPFWTYFYRIPKPEIALMEEWEEKIAKLIESTKNKNVTTLVGVPSWFLVFLKKLMENTGANNILDIWPNLELFIHGGISFAPYRNVYNQIIPSDNMKYMETYNASEGFFAIQNDLNSKDMLLMLDYGIYYEFIPMNEYGLPNMKAIPLEDVKTDVNYAIVITTNGGLWRYIIGDTIKFTSTNPYKIKITGRTRHFINAFGEELIIDNAQGALQEACDATGAQIREYTAAPVFMDENQKGKHQWIIEFVKSPDSLDKFKEELDKNLKKRNSDYEAKRYKDITLDAPDIYVVKETCFYKWMETRGKLGGQNKVPRLANNRLYADELIEFDKNLK